MSSHPNVSLELARALIEAAETKAAGIGVPMALCVSDAAGEPIVLVRMDGASLAAVQTVAAKARTAVAFGRPTAETVERSRQNPTVYGSFMTVGAGAWVLSMGGLPLMSGGSVVGAVAASGGSGEEDISVAEAGLTAWSG